MSQYDELKRLAEAAQYESNDTQRALIASTAAFFAACIPEQVLALIVENEAMAGLLKKFVDGEHDQDENQAERHMYFTEAQSMLALVNGEIEGHTIVPDSAIKAIRGEVDQLKAELELAQHIGRLAYNFDGYKAVLDERDQLRAEIAGLKTGYQAYERVNAELKAENERLRVGMTGGYDLDAWLEWTREAEALREANDMLTRRNGMLEQNVEVMTEAHVLYTWLRKKCDQPSNDQVAVQMNIGHDWVPVQDLDRDLRTMIDREEP